MRLLAVKLLCVVATLSVLGLGAGTAHAGGYGGYLESEISSSNIDDGGRDRAFDAEMWGLGVMWDGNIAVDELLNYRIEFGYRLGKRDLDEHSNETVNGITLDQTLGVGFFRRSLFRVWAGPSVRLNFDWYSSAGDRDIVDVAIGVGPRVGVNIHLTETISLTTSVAYHYMYLSELIEFDGLNKTVDGPQHIVGVRIGVLWRGEDDVWDGE